MVMPRLQTTCTSNKEQRVRPHRLIISWIPRLIAGSVETMLCLDEISKRFGFYLARKEIYE